MDRLLGTRRCMESAEVRPGAHVVGRAPVASTPEYDQPQDAVSPPLAGK